MFEYKTFSNQPNMVEVGDDVLYNVETRSARPTVKYRFGITDLGGGSWSAWEFEKREILSGVDELNLAAVQSALTILYNSYLAVYNSHSVNLLKVHNFNGLSFDI